MHPLLHAKLPRVKKILGIPRVWLTSPTEERGCVREPKNSLALRKSSPVSRNRSTLLPRDRPRRTGGTGSTMARTSSSKSSLRTLHST